MEHWLPLFHPDLVPLTAYLDPEAEIGLDHLARDAIKARAALIGEHYEARLTPVPPGTSFGAAPYRALPPELLYLDEGGVERELASHTRLEFSHFGPPPRPPAGIAGSRIWAVMRHGISHPSAPTARSTSSIPS